MIKNNFVPNMFSVTSCCVAFNLVDAEYCFDFIHGNTTSSVNDEAISDVTMSVTERFA